MGYNFNASTGVFTEDFNYGQPWPGWSTKLPPLKSPPEFRYSGEEHTNDGILVSSSYARRQFTLQKGTKATEPTNIDWGVFGGSHAANPYYLLFPILQWNQTQMITLWCYCTSDAVLTYLHSFDGFVMDHFHLVVNKKVMKVTSHTAGHGWTQDQVAIKRGSNEISWVLQTAPDVGWYTRRGGIAFPPIAKPNIPRYFRLTDITINNLAYGPRPPTVYEVFPGSSTGTSNAIVDIIAHAKWFGSAAQGYQVKWSGSIDLEVFTSMLGALTGSVIEGSAVWSGESEADTKGSVQHLHESYDGGFELGSSGSLTVIVSLDTHQGLLIAPLKTVAITPTVPTIINGIPKTIDYLGTQTMTVSSHGTYVSAAPKTPTDPSHALPVIPTLWWVATDITTPDDSDVLSWPEHRSVANPAWQSNYIYAPTSFGHQRFHAEGLDYVSYSKVVHFWWRYVQHMWVDVGSTNIPATTSPFTWMITGMMHPMTSDQHQYVLDNGFPTPDYTDDVLDSVEDNIFGVDGSASNHFGLKPDAMQMRSVAGNPYINKQARITTKPAVYTVVFNGSHSVYHCYANHLHQRIAVKLGWGSDSRFVLGRAHGWVADHKASHMSLMEVGFWNRALSDAEIQRNSDYLMAVYQFQKY